MVGTEEKVITETDSLIREVTSEGRRFTVYEGRYMVL